MTSKEEYKQHIKLLLTKWLKVLKSDEIDPWKACEYVQNEIEKELQIK